MPQAEFKVTGDIADIGRVDNLFAALKRETMKALKAWKIEVTVQYTEQQGGGEVS